MINYTWDCRTVDTYVNKDGNHNVVFNVHWTLTGEDSETAVINTAIGTQLLNTDNLENFVPKDDLTNDVVAGWVIDELGEERVNKLKDIIEKQINEQVNPTVETITIS